MKQIFAILLIFITLATRAQDDSVYLQLVEKSDDAITKMDYVGAIGYLKDALAADPGNPSNVLLMSNLGLLYSDIGSDSLAIDILNHAHNIAPAMVQVLENRAVVYGRLDNREAALADYAKIIELDSLHTVARFYHGLLKMYDGDIDTAKKDFDVLADAHPDEYATWFSQAMYNTATGNYRAAAPYYKKLIEVDPSVDFYGELAHCYLMQGELSEAAAILGEAMELYPDDAQIYYYRAWLNRDSFRYKDARSDADRAIALGADKNAVNALFE